MSSRRKHWAVTCARLLRLHALHASSSAAAAANAAAAHPRERPTSLAGSRPFCGNDSMRQKVHHSV